MSRIISSEGRVFVQSEKNGDFTPAGFNGFFFQDVRHLSLFHVLINNQFPHILNSSEISYNNSLFVKTNIATENLPEASVTLVQERVVDDGIFETFKFINNSNSELNFKLSIKLDTDFADIFEVNNNLKDLVKKLNKVIECRTEDDLRIIYRYQNDGFYRETVVEFSERFSNNDKEYIFDVNLKPKEIKLISMFTGVENQFGIKLSPNKNIYSISSSDHPDYSLPQFPTLETDWYDLKKLYEQSLNDLLLLRSEYVTKNGEQVIIPLAGFPWYMTLFGRDSAITAYQMLGFDNNYSMGVLKALADYQGTVVDLENDEEPGKIIHELRFGEVAHFEDWVKFPYFGTIDSTALFLKLFVGLRKYYTEGDFFIGMKDNVLRAIEWIDKYGDLDGDGFIEYHRKNPKGLRNQNWRDSEDSMMFSTGELAESPIASADVQGYVYDAKMGVAEIAEFFWKDMSLAEKLRNEAQILKKNFNEKFWLPEKGFFGLGLDKDKKIIDTLSSSNGHLLWSEIVDEDKREQIIEKLFSTELFSGWGIRTITKNSPRFNPLGYHLGSVWPHDNSIIARGLQKAKYNQLAVKLVDSMISTSKFYNYRLPELFSGYDRTETYFPVSYPTSASPQAWAASSALQFIKVILGIELDYKNQQVIVKPHLDGKCKYINLKGFDVFGKRIDIEVTDKTSELRIG